MIQVGIYYQAGCFLFPFLTLCLPCLFLWFQVSWCPLLLGVVTAECNVCLVKYFCIMIWTKPWHMVMASTNVATLSIEALCSFSVKLWLIYVSHGAVPLPHALCLLVFFFIALKGCCDLCFGKFLKWESGSWTVAGNRKAGTLGLYWKSRDQESCLFFSSSSSSCQVLAMCGFDFSFSDGILQFVDHHITAYIWRLCPHSWWVHPAFCLAGPAFIFLKFSPDLLSNPAENIFIFVLSSWIGSLSFTVWNSHILYVSAIKRLIPAQPMHIRFDFFQSVLTSSWAIIIIQIKCCRESDNIADLGLFWTGFVG